MSVSTQPVREPGARRAPAARSGRWIKDWRPEDPAFWQARGRRVARRNLALSILAEHLAFSMGLLWSTVVLFLTPQTGFDFSDRQLLWLLAVPTLVGSTLRIPYTFAVARFGGASWTVVIALLLLVPTGGLAYCVSTRRRTGCSCWWPPPRASAGATSPPR